MRRVFLILALLALCGASFASAADPNWDAGVKAYKAQDYAAAIAAFQKYVESPNGDNYQGHLMLGQALLKGKKYPTAATHLKRALELKPGDSTSQLALSQAQLLDGKNTDACRTLGTVTEASLPAASKTALYELRARAECGGGNAVADLKKVAEAKNDATSWATYASAVIADGDLATGMAALERALKLDPNDARVHKNYVRALVQQGKASSGSAQSASYAKAVQAAEALLKVEPGYENTELLGEMQMAAKQYSQALATFNRAASLDANAWSPLFSAGQALSALDRNAEAVDPLKKALALARSAEDQQKIRNHLGFVHEKQRNWAESISNYEKAGNTAAVARVQASQKTYESAGVDATKSGNASDSGSPPR